MREITVQEKDAGQRLDKYIGRVLKKAPLSFIYKSLRNKDIRLNTKKAAGNEILKAGDIITLRFPNVQTESLLGETKEQQTENSAIHLSDFCTILYEDGEMILADKKAGVLSQQTKAGEVTLNEALLSYVGGGSDLFTPSVCNRIDRNTTGLVAFAKTYRAARMLSEAFRNRSARKYYLAGVLGEVRGQYHEKAFLKKESAENKVTIAEEGSEIETAWEDISHAFLAGRPVTLLKVELITGKTHQIRAHLASQGYPVIGDPKYGGKVPGVPYQMLHAYELILPDGRSFTAPIPGRMRRLFKDFHEVGLSGGTDKSC